MPFAASMTNIQAVGLHQLRKNWGWFLALGIALVGLGTIAIIYSVATTLASVIVLGVVLAVAGIVKIVHAFSRERGWGGFFLDLLGGVLYGVVGFVLMTRPGSSALALTLAIAVFLVFMGVTRVVFALSVDFQHRGWMIFAGVIGALLGVSIWVGWPATGLWLIGLFVGIELVLDGWTAIMLGIAARQIPTTAPEVATVATPPAPAHEAPEAPEQRPPTHH